MGAEEDAESCTGGDVEKEEEMMQGNNGRDKRRSTVVDNAWRTWFHPESCSSSCDQEIINGEQQCVRIVLNYDVVGR
ncbi:hypothetical protein J5N97_015166 [Dioscorea zingiberensis]|uniref:Uncharacterized protein n=1 Tax=Dioscorea zingiberensis TaxID=325984 RepID=A0A9D5CW14_9LILI|nr:hypothetical protein J5N97_015166 [Dioscorea zingiberensis]